MERMRRHDRLLPAVFLPLLATGSSDPLQGPQRVGSRLPDVTLEDQQGAAHQFDDSLRLVLMSRDMEAGEVSKKALAEVGPEALERRAALYVSDISRAAHRTR